jgi:hypothetical protein
VREYLSGLVEESPLKDIFAAWYRHVVGVVPPPADEIVVPNAARLEEAASAELDRADPQRDGVIIDLEVIRDKPLVVAAVELANATRYAQEGTGSCDICSHVEPPEIGPGVPHEPVVKPPEPVEPELPGDPFGEIPH